MTGLPWLPVAVLALALPGGAALSQDPCSGYGTTVETAWGCYRAGEIARADSLFARAHAVCPARVGLGYTALRGDRLADANRWFAGVLAADSSDIDARAGLALVAFRTGDSLAAAREFERVLRADSSHAMAREFLDRLGVRPPPARSPLVLPDTIETFARAQGSRFEVLADAGWRPFYVRGINLGAALPGRYPSEFPDSAVYAGWIAEIAAMEANVTASIRSIRPTSTRRSTPTTRRTPTDRSGFCTASGPSCRPGTTTAPRRGKASSSRR